MANNVTTRLVLESGNEEAQAFFQAIVNKASEIHEDKKARKEAGEDVRVEVNLYELNDDTMALYNDKDWGNLIDKIGSKWAYLEDWYDEQITIVSAWGIPEDYILRVARELGEIDETAVLSAMYDDEMPNFVGVNVYAEGDTYDSFQLDSDEYSDYDLELWWDEDEHDGEEEPDDFEPTWDELWTLLENEKDDMIEGFNTYRKEREEELAEEQEKYKGE